MKHVDLKRIRSKISAFPAMPGNAHRVLNVLRDPTAGADAIEQVVGLDPGLTANILRFANSAFVGLRGKVGSLKDAVVQLGIQRLSEMTVAASVNSMMAEGIEGYDIEPGEMWRHSIGVAVGAEILARDLGLGVRGDAFTAGLLHDVGKMVCGEFVGERWSELTNATRDDIPFDAAERAVLAVDHAEIGAEILAHWALPGILVNAVRWHHRPDSNTDTESQPLVDVVHIADAIALMIGLNDGREGLRYEISSAVTKRLGLDGAQVEVFGSRLVIGAQEMLDVIAGF